SVLCLAVAIANPLIVVAQTLWFPLVLSYLQSKNGPAGLAGPFIITLVVCKSRDLFHAERGVKFSEWRVALPGLRASASAWLADPTARVQLPFAMGAPGLRPTCARK